jgi:hypothetical protein
MYRGGLVLYHIGREIRFYRSPCSGGYELRYSERGYPFRVWKSPVPLIADWFLNCVVYLYPSADYAVDGVAIGGTGFLVWVPSEVDEDHGVTYCVTNSHIVREAASPVIRLNTKDGGMDIIELTQDDWVVHQDGDDLAVCPLDINADGPHNIQALRNDLFATKEFVKRQAIGPGDEVFMVGRFVNHEGRQRNTPSVRFGNISMMPEEAIMHERGYRVESYLIETRSLSGYSGSPVFLYHAPLAPYPKGYPQREAGNWLLGVDWGHLRMHEKVRWKDDKSPVDENWIVESNSGQTTVAPAWKLQELLDQGDLPMGRKRYDDELAKRKKSSPVSLDMRDDAPESFTRADFFRDLKKAARKQEHPSQPDEERR